MRGGPVGVTFSPNTGLGKHRCGCDCRRCELGYHCNVQVQRCHQDIEKWKIWLTETMNWPRVFKGYRPKPPAHYLEAGLANGGVVPDYEGIVFSDGTTAVRWMTKVRSTAIFGSFAEFSSIHGHPDYGTRIEFEDGRDENGDAVPIVTAA